MTLRAAPPDRAAAPRGGYVIFAVLLVIVVLSLVAYRFADSMTSEYRAAVRLGDDARAKAAALSGLHYAAAVLADRNTFLGQLAGNPYDNPGAFDQVAVASSGGGDRAYFSIRSAALNDDGTYSQRSGVIDEGGKLNVNSMIAMDATGQLLHDALMKLPNMTEDVADAIVDWVDADEDARASGAESAYYQSLPGAYKSKNGPLNSLDELLLVKGVTPSLLYGGDANRNGTQDQGEADGTRGWSDYLTVYGRELNVDTTGTARIYLNGDDLNTTYQQLQQAVGMDMAVYVVASKLMNPTKVQTATATLSTGSGGGGTVTLSFSAAPSTGNNSRPTVTGTTADLQAVVEEKLASAGTSGQRIKSVMDLIGTQVTLPRAQGAKQTDPDVVVPSPLNDPAQVNQLLPLMLEKATAQQAIEMVPRINVNTAPREVLAGLMSNGQPLLTDAQVEGILGQRAGQAPTDPATLTGAWLVTSGVLAPGDYKKVEKYLTGSSMVYRVQAVGYTERAGPLARFEAVIDTNQGAPRFLHVRDLADIENPRGFPAQPPSQ
jgi:type II secretory pathway component PulK